MERMLQRYSLCLVLLVTGCSSTSNWLSSKPKSAPKSDDPVSGLVSVGSQDLESSKKADPIKLHLAYAAWHEQSGNYAEARLSYLKVLEKNRKDSEAMLGLARIDRFAGREAEADQQLKKTLKCHPKDPKVLVAIGQVHADRKEWPQALEKMRAAYDLEPYNTIYQYHLAIVEAHSGDLFQAMAHFTRSVGDAEAHFNVAVILKEQGRTIEAENHLMKALALKPELKQAETALASIRTSRSADDVQPASFSRKSRF